MLFGQFVGAWDLQITNLPPAPERGHSTWRSFLGHYREYMVACDFVRPVTIR